MVFNQTLLLYTIVLILILYIINVTYLNHSHLNGVNYNDSSQETKECEQLHLVINYQNATIHTMESIINSDNKVNNLLSQIESNMKEIEELKNELKILKTTSNELTNNLRNHDIRPDKTVENNIGSFISHFVEGTTKKEEKIDEKAKENNKMIVDLSTFDQDCESRYGITLIDNWKNNHEIWCESNNNKIISQLECYPYHQQHKKLDGRGSDLFCTATNFVIDFTKISGKIPTSKQPLGQQYLSFQHGSLQGDCKITSKYKKHLFMPHHSLQMNSFQSDIPIDNNIEVYDTPLYLLARDEDCENLFHSTADFMNAYLVLTALNQDPSNIQVMLFDQHPDGPYIDLIKAAFSPNHPILRHNHFHKKILFKKLFFHLESPAGLIFPKVSRPGPLQCYSTSLFQNYRKFILKSFNLYNVLPPSIPTITLSLRKRTDKKNVGRILQNEDEIVSVLNQGNLINVNVIDGGKMSFSEQLKLIRNTNILIGVHGAGLMMIMFAAEEAILIEMHPSYRQDRHFRHAARMTGKIYMPLRTLQRETCQGTSDNVVIPVQEFKQTLDGAVRIARSFDDGLSECGLICPYEILALDNKLLPYYGPKDKKVTSVNTHFPCG